MIRSPEKSKESKERGDNCWCFQIYLGFCFYSGKVRPTYQKTVAIEKLVCYSHFPSGGATPLPTQKHRGSTQVSQQAVGVRGKSQQKPWLWEGMGEAG